MNDAGDGSITKPLTINTKYPFDGGFVAHDEIEGRKATQNDIYFRQGVGKISSKQRNFSFFFYNEFI